MSNPAALPCCLCCHAACVAMLPVLPCCLCCHAACVAMLPVLPCGLCCHAACVAMRPVLPCCLCCHAACVAMRPVWPCGLSVRRYPWQALSISRALLAAKAAVEAAHSSAGESERGEGHAQAADASAVVERVRQTVEEAGGRVEYVQLVEQEGLEPISHITCPAVLAVAAHFGSVRLIDNVEIDVHA
ncbi:unnamed protein product [Closterium sp. Naga37s-1]|nr:unnamed protein product [Closterium sp. Naga37s-1]